MAKPDADLELAEAEAEEASALLAEMERQSLELDPAKRPGAEQVSEARLLYEFASKRIAVAEKRAEAARAAARLEALGELGADIDRAAAAAGGPDGERLAGHLANLAAAAAVVRSHCQQHDAAVADLSSRAADLGTEPPGQYGPRASSGYVMREQQGGSVRHRGTQVSKIGPDIASRAIGLAGNGDTDAAVALVATVRHVSNRADHYFIDSLDGSLMPVNGHWRRPPYLELARTGRIRPATEDEIRGHLGEDS